MLFPTYKRLFKTDYPQDQQDLIDKLSVPVNSGFEVVYNAMSHNVSLADNIFCTITTLQAKVDAAGTPVSPISFKLATTGVIKGNQVIQVRNLTNERIFPTSTPFISYRQDSGFINVSNITGLPAGNLFELTVISWG